MRITKMLGFLKNTIINAAGAAVGFLEFVGLKYPVTKYRFKVSDALWRGSRLDAGAIASLKNDGFNLIVNLCAENDNDHQPGAIAGIQTLHIPIIDNESPSEQQMIGFLNAVIKPTNQPVYVHCEAGKGRTGVAVGCYRIIIDKWTGPVAVAEAEKFGMAMPNQEQFLLRFAKDWESGRIAIKDGIITLS